MIANNQHYPPITNWTDAYENGAYIPNASDFPPRWNTSAAAFRERLGERAELNIAYGDKPRQRLDLFRPLGTAQGLFVFVHGGYWKAFDQSTWSHFAQALVEAGWAVAMPAYTLAPEARIADITQEIAAAITQAASLVDGPIHLSGHSAGGHLVTRMLCANGPLATPEAADVLSRIRHVVSISGVHDLRPLLKTDMNTILNLDTAEAVAESVVLQEPIHSATLLCLVGGAERPEFIRQSALLANIWAGCGLETKLVVAEGKHHFDVIDALCNADQLAMFATNSGFSAL